jgi:hypothetical protein
MSIVYEGKQPYIFISYAHKDNAAVLPIIHKLQNEGFRVWYDEGIEAGSEWPDYIAFHLKHSKCIVSMISAAFADSLFCRQELTYSQKHRIPMLNIYLESVTLPDGLDMQLSDNQALYRESFSDNALFFEKLCSAKLLQSCREPVRETAPEEENDKEEPISPPQPADTEKNQPCSKGWRRFLQIAAVLSELAYIIAGIMAMDVLTANFSGIFDLVGKMIVPHAVLALIAVLLVMIPRKKVGTETRKNILVWNMFLCLLTGLIAAALSVSKVNLEIGFAAKIFASLGLNILPVLAAELLYFVCLMF